MIKDTLEETCSRLQDMELFAVALGPGSFTGLRIGVATAKSLASTLERRIVGVPTMQAIARAAGPGPCVVALLPAGRGELFAQSFRVESTGALLPLDTAAHVAPDILLERFRHVRNARWAGEGAHAQSEKICAIAKEESIPFIKAMDEKENSLDEGWVLASLEKNLAAYVGLLAFEKYNLGETCGPEDLRAIYVRLSDAELKEKC